MRIQKVLVEVDKLFRRWEIRSDDWIFTANYAAKMLGYDVEVRKGHLNILVKRNNIPWKLGDELETHPPINSKHGRDYQKFMEVTGFEFDINPLIDKKFKRRMMNTVNSQVTDNIRVNILNGWGGLEELDELLSLCTNEA